MRSSGRPAIPSRELTDRVNAWSDEITAIVTPMVPGLLALHGCGALSAAKIVGETAGIDQFKSRPRTPGGMGPPPSRCGAEAPTSGSTEAGTVRSTPPFTALR